MHTECMHSTRPLTGLLIYSYTVVSVASLNQQAVKTFGLMWLPKFHVTADGQVVNRSGVPIYVVHGNARSLAKMAIVPNWT